MDEGRHSADSKERMRESARTSRARVAQERGAYLSEAALQSIRDKLAERLTPDRRRRFAEDNREALLIARKTRQIIADAFARRYERVIRMMQNQGMKLTEIAMKLTADGHTAPRGGPWTDQTVRQVLKRMPQKTKSRDLSSEVLDAMKPAGNPRFIGWNKLTP